MKPFAVITLAGLVSAQHMFPTEAGFPAGPYGHQKIDELPVFKPGFDHRPESVMHQTVHQPYDTYHKTATHTPSEPSHFEFLVQ